MGKRSFGPRGPHGRESLPNNLYEVGKHIVYAEGTRTEPEYVRSIEKAIFSNKGSRNGRFPIIQVGEKKKGLNTVKLVEFAFKDIAKRRKNGESFDYVWIFFDLDQFPKEDYMAAIRKIEAKNSESNRREHFLGEPCDEYGTRWVSCHSARCFELWGCLYFSYYQTVTDNCDDYIDTINKALKNAGIEEKYQKNRDDLHQLLTRANGSIANAIKYARKLNQENGDDNPSTHIDAFGEYFEKYVSK